jgi:hypothetical protein
MDPANYKPGRVFNSSPKLKTTTKTAPRSGFAAGKPALPTAPKAKDVTPGPTMAKAKGR